MKSRLFHTEHTQTDFVISIPVLDIYKSFIEKNFNKNSTIFSLKIEGDNMVARITPNEKSNEDIELEFRKVIARLTAQNILSSNQADQITRNFETFLEHRGLRSSYKPKVHRDSSIL